MQSNAKSLLGLPPHEFAALYERFKRREASAGEVIVTQGDKGDTYYIIQSGHAQVWRGDPLDDQTLLVAELGPGDAFGEEAVILGGFRNATVKMVTDGVLLVLDRATFDDVIRSNYVIEIDAAEAQRRVAAHQAVWLDCRYAMEYDETHIEGAKLVELHQIREASLFLDRDTEYIVYCRSGRRSACAAFLLSERGFKAVSLKGGLLDWPFSIEKNV